MWRQVDVSRGFCLNARGQEQLNFEVLRDNMKEEVCHPLARSRDMPMWNPHKILRVSREKKLMTET